MFFVPRTGEATKFRPECRPHSRVGPHRVFWTLFALPEPEESSSSLFSRGLPSRALLRDCLPRGPSWLLRAAWASPLLEPVPRGPRLPHRPGCAAAQNPLQSCPWRRNCVSYSGSPGHSSRVLTPDQQEALAGPGPGLRAGPWWWQLHQARSRLRSWNRGSPRPVWSRPRQGQRVPGRRHLPRQPLLGH